VASPLVGPPVVKPKALYCPNCGGPVERRGFAHTLTVVCPQCLSVLDATTPLLSILQKVEEAQRRTPKIPLGQRGVWNTVPWEAIGFQTRAVEDDGETFEWEEYLLFNPYKGFRYLVTYNGHWNFVTPMESLPERMSLGVNPAVRFEGRVFKHFSGADATTSFVLGEFPWRVKVGESVLADDFINPPIVLSSETTENECTWSRGEYTSGDAVWKAFNLEGSAPPAQGVYLNQPSPYHGSIGGIWKMWMLMLGALIVLAILFAAGSGGVDLDKRFSFVPGLGNDSSVLSEVFELKGRTSALEMEIKTNLKNNWAYFNCALINQDTGDAYNFGREVSYYNGSDSDGAWSEGGPSTSVTIPSVPAGHYRLLIEPEMDTGNSSLPAAARARQSSNANIYNTVDCEVILHHGVPVAVWYWFAAILLLIPPIIYSIRARSFEVRRWADSDHPLSSSSSGGD